MATLAADVELKFDPRWDIGLVQKTAAAIDIYYRGGVAHHVVGDGKITLTPVDADTYAGVIQEHKTVAANDLVWIGSAGRWFFTNSNFTIAAINDMFAIPGAGTLFDNPADLHVADANDPGAAGTLWLVGTTATNGWLNTDTRAAASNS